jgi:hypothetical protein
VVVLVLPLLPLRLAHRCRRRCRRRRALGGGGGGELGFMVQLGGCAASVLLS